MPEEIGSDLSHLRISSCSDHGDLTIHRGSGMTTVRLSLAWSGWGKVCAARAATRVLLRQRSQIDLLVFTGLPALPMDTAANGMCCWPNAVVQHDMDAAPCSPASRCLL